MIKKDKYFPPGLNIRMIYQTYIQIIMYDLKLLKLYRKKTFLILYRIELIITHICYTNTDKYTIQ